MKNNILNEIKTTIIGILLIGAGFYYEFYIEDSNTWFAGCSVLLGVGLLFAKDRIINILLNFLKKKSEE